MIFMTQAQFPTTRTVEKPYYPQVGFLDRNRLSSSGSLWNCTILMNKTHGDPVSDVPADHAWKHRSCTAYQLNYMRATRAMLFGKFLPVMQASQEYLMGVASKWVWLLKKLHCS